MAVSEEDHDKMMIPLMVSKSMHMELKLYSVKIGKPMKDILRPISLKLEQELLSMVADIKEMERQAELRRMKEEEDQRVAAENPMKVLGHEVDATGPELEPPIPN